MGNSAGRDELAVSTPRRLVAASTGADEHPRLPIREMRPAREHLHDFVYRLQSPVDQAPAGGASICRQLVMVGRRTDKVDSAAQIDSSGITGKSSHVIGVQRLKTRILAGPCNAV